MLKKDGMEISDELIACYVERTVTAEERAFVRKYLCKHPQEYERILCLMDNDVIDYLGERIEVSDDCLSTDASSFSDIALSAAAFAPEQNRKVIINSKLNINRVGVLHNQLNNMWEELDKI